MAGGLIVRNEVPHFITRKICKNRANSHLESFELYHRNKFLSIKPF